MILIKITMFFSDSQEEIESLRERMQAQTSLVVVGSADDALRVGKTKRQIEGVTQAMVDNMIIDEVSEFANACILNPPTPRDLHAENAQLTNGGLTTTTVAVGGAPGAAGACATAAACSASAGKKRRSSTTLDAVDVSIGPAAAKSAKASRLMAGKRRREKKTSMRMFCNSSF